MYVCKPSSAHGLCSCARAYAQLCVHVCVRVCVCAHVHFCVHVCVRACVCDRASEMHVSPCVHSASMQECMYVNMCVRAQLHVCEWVCVDEHAHDRCALLKAGKLVCCVHLCVRASMCVGGCIHVRSCKHACVLV